MTLTEIVPCAINSSEIGKTVGHYDVTQVADNGNEARRALQAKLKSTQDYATRKGHIPRLEAVAVLPTWIICISVSVFRGERDGIQPKLSQSKIIPISISRMI